MSDTVSTDRKVSEEQAHADGALDGHLADVRGPKDWGKRIHLVDTADIGYRSQLVFEDDDGNEYRWHLADAFADR